MIKKFIYILYILLITFFSGFSQVSNIGKILTYKKTTSGIEGKTTSAYFYVNAYSDNIVRIKVSQNKNTDNFSYALASTEMPTFKNFTVKDRDNSLELSTSELIVVVEKAPTFRVIFKNKQGIVINEDKNGEGFGTCFIGDKLSIYKKLQLEERFIGLGEALGNLDRRGTGITLNNTDNYKYGDPRVPMYSSIPFYIGILKNDVYGLFFNNSYKTFFNFGLSTPNFISINADGGDADYFFFYDRSVSKIIEHYTQITGRMPLPPAWSLGYHQSRCSYYPQSNVKILAELFRKKQIPVDCIVLDADYLQDYEPFRINTSRFPDLPGLAKELANMNIEITASVNPGIRIDSSFEAHNDGLLKDIFLKYPDGSLFVSDIAPNTNHFPDFTNPKARNWWIDQMKFLPDIGIHGYWNDMNEPAVGGSYLPDNLSFDFDGRKGNSLKAKNIYGMQMARSSFESAIKYGKGKRPFVLSRSGFAGIQRYAAVWSGDNTASDDHLLNGVLLNNMMGLSGLPFSGYDIGGYIGDGTKDLFKRWIEVGVFSPFVRNHKEFFATANEPWSYGEEAEAISKTYINFRYRLLPYIYSIFYDASQTGLPVSRSLAINDPFDAKVYDNIYQYQFLFGDAFMIVPVTTKERIKKLYLPPGSWYNIYSDEKLTGPKEWEQEFPIYQLPVYIKASSIIPMQQTVQSTKDNHGDTLSVHIFNGTDSNSFNYYEDDGKSFNYKTGNYCKRVIKFNAEKKQIIFSAQDGQYNSVYKYLKIILHDFDQSVHSIQVNEIKKEILTAQVSLVDPLEFLSDFYDKTYYKTLANGFPKPVQKILVVDNSANEIKISYQ